MKNRNKFILASLAVLAFFIAAPLVSHAMTLKKGDNIFVDQDITGNLLTAGNLVVIESTVDGDVFVAGNNIVISGTVNGDVFAAGNNIEITGAINGNLRFVGSNVRLGGDVERNILGIGNNFNIEEGSSVGRHVTYGGANLFINSPVGGQVDVSSEGVIVNNKISGDLRAELGNTGELILLKNAVLDGDLKYKAKKEADIREGAQIIGEVNYSVWEAPVRDVKIPDASQIGAVFTFFKIMSLLALLVTGLFILYLTPKLNEKIYQEMSKKFWSNLGLGFVFLIVAPVVCLLLLITILGMPLGIVLFLLYMIGIYFAKVIAAIGIGRFITEKFGWKLHKVFTLILGALVLCLLSLIPVLGWVVAFAAVLWALGAMIKIDNKILKDWR